MNTKNLPRIFIDMDGVIVDFEAYMAQGKLSAAEVKAKPGAYFDMPPMAGALAGVRRLIELGFEVWIATKPPAGVAHAYGDKAAWIHKWLPELERRIIITHDKGLLGSKKDYLIDDRPHKANCEEFAGELIPFNDGMTWGEIEGMFSFLATQLRKQQEAEISGCPA